MVRVIRGLGEVEALRDVWSRWRGHRDADIDVFRTVLRHASDAAEPFIFVVERDGRPDAILIGNRSTRTLRRKIAYVTMRVPRVRVLSFQYSGLLGNNSEENSELLIRGVLASLRNKQIDVAILGYIRHDSPLSVFARQVPPAIMRGDRFADVQTHCLMNLPGSVDAVFSGLSGDHRKKLRAEAKKFEAEFPGKLAIRRFDGPDQVSELMRDAERAAATTYQRALGVGFSNNDVIRDLLTLEAEKGWLRGYILYIDDRPCAFWIGNVYNSVFLSDFLGHDPAYAKYSPGNYLLTHVIKELCADGIAAVDFGVGEALYKQRFGRTTWQENEIFLYALTLKGMQAKALHMGAGYVSIVGKRLLGADLTARLKRLWRNHLTRSGPKA